MSVILANFIILARNGDGEDTGWSQILVFVVLAVFWVVGGIMKAKTEKANRQKQKQKPQGPKPSCKPLFQQVQNPVTQRTILQPKAAPKRVEKFQKQVSKPVKMAEEVKRAERKVVKVAQKEAEPALEAQRHLIPEDTEQLQTAILHYEILAKPLALREAKEQL